MLKRSLCVILLFTSFSAFSQLSAVSKSDTTTVGPSKFIPAPYVNYSRSIGFAGGIVPMYMWNLNKKDTISPQSLVGGMGMYSTNKTYFAMGFGKLYFNEDRWRISFGGGNGNVNFQVYISDVVNRYIDYATNFWIFKTYVKRRIIPSIYLGLVIDYTKFDTSFDTEQNLAIENQFMGYGLVLERDVRSNVYYPYSGDQEQIEWNSYPTWLSNLENSNKLKVSANKFWPFRGEKDVLAARIYGEFGLGEIAFNQEVVVMGTDLRGYTQGKYRGDGMADIQMEYRYNFAPKMGLVGFAGIGTVYGADNEDINGLILPSVGLGYRFTVFPTNHMNIGLDAAFGRDDWGIYFRIGEAF